MKSTVLITLGFIANIAAADAGVKPAGPATPEMLAAMNRMHETGRVAGQRGSLTFFRWSSTQPSRLAHLGLWGGQIDNDLIEQTETMPDLEFVSLYETRVDDTGLRALAKLPRLRFLSVIPVERYEKAGFGPPQWSYPFLKPDGNRPRITGKVLVSLTSISTLEGLDLCDAVVEPADLSALSAWANLGSVGLPCVIDNEVGKHLQSCRRLSNLTLGHRRISAAEIRCLATWKSLRKLTLIHAVLDSEALQALSRLETVQTLELNSCGLSDDDLIYLGNPPKLTELILSRNEIAGPGLSHIAAWAVKSLDLNFNNLSDATLSHLPPLKNIERLNLAYNFGITDVGIKGGALQAMPALLDLELRGNKAVTDACVEELAKFSRLKRLGIRQNGISEAGCARLKQALPQTTVFK